MTMTISTSNDPFSCPSADFVIHTKDGISFSVHRSILEESSPFWRDLLSLPQATRSKGDNSNIVDVPEISRTIRHLLELTYPIPDPVLTSIEDIGAVLDAAIKFEMGEAVRKIQTLLTAPQFLKEQATRVYAIACRYGLDDLAKIASRETLRFHVLDGPLLEELKFITAHDYHRLLSLHRERSLAAQALIKLPESSRCPQCSATAHFGVVLAPKWWEYYEKRAIEELKKSPTSDVIFSWPFLAQAAKAGCQRCGTSIIESYDFFMDLKKQIDELPNTI